MLKVIELVKATNGNLLNGDLDFIPKDYIIDSRNIVSNPFFVPIIGEKTDGHNYIVDAVKCGICGYFINKNCNNKENIINETKKINKNIVIVEVENTKEALYKAGEYNRNKHINIPVIAVTGSVGKTSTREMIASVLKTEKKVLVTKYNYNSIIGAPIMALQIEDQDVCVLEIGTDYKGEIERLSNLLKPNIGVITMIGTAHIGNFGSRKNIFNEKIQIISHMQENSSLVLNKNDDFLSKLKLDSNISIKYFDNSDIVELKEDINGIEFKTNIYGKKEIVKLSEIGLHNAKNAICAIKIAEIFNLSVNNILKGINNYKNFSRRLEKIRIKDNILLIDDTYNASIDSMKSGLETVNKLNAKRKIAVLGDMLELGEFSEEIHSEVGKMFKNLHYDMLYVLGNKAKYISKEASNFLITKEYDNIENLIKDLQNTITTGDLVYFKASNGMNFNKIINALKE